MTRHRKPTLVFVMGPTCAGKSAMLQEAMEYYARARILRAVVRKLGIVEVGKELRAKYPPSYFKGLNNPKHTAQEAWDLCVERIGERVASGCEVILVDGQPRDVEQARRCAVEFADFDTTFWLLDASLEERERRARETRSGEDLETLAIPRLTNDMISNYSVIVKLLSLGRQISIIDTNNNARLSLDRLFYPVLSDLLTPHRRITNAQD